MSARIMVIEDAPEMLELFQELLQDEGYEVFPYGHDIDDLSEIERISPDLIVLDYIMDGAIVGRPLLKRLKTATATASIPVIICTAASNAAQAALEADHLTSKVRLVAKPFDVEDLLTALQQTLAVEDQTRDRDQS